jgi:hypothetical protein
LGDAFWQKGAVMERLTRRSANGTGVYATPSGEPVKWENNRHNVLQKLADYEDLEEQGRLIKLPCKVGDTVYEIHYTNRQYVILSHVVSKFVIIPYRFPRVEIYFENENGFSTSDLLGQLNEDLFLTRVEAEAKLEELRGKENESSN